MLHKFLLRRELAKLRELEQRREYTTCIIKAEQVALEQEAIRGMASKEGLLLSFAAGCAASLAIRYGPSAANLRHFPLSQVLALVSLVAQLKRAD